MTTSPLETVAEKKFYQWVKDKRKELCFKINPLGRRGLPDRVIIGADRLLFFIEFKRRSEEPRKLQTYVHNILKGFGFNVYICYRLEGAQTGYWKERGTTPDNGN